MTTSKIISSLVVPSTLIAALIGGCASGDDAVNEQLDGVESSVAIEPLASFSGAGGLQFASQDVADQWHQEARGLWRHEDGHRRLIIGADGHRAVIDQLEAELDALYAEGADDAAIEVVEAQLVKYRQTRALAAGPLNAGTTCNIGLYTGPSGPIFGFTGGAALAQLSCQGGTVVFTVESLVCTGTTGCSPTAVQTAVPTSTPGLWGTVRSGLGSCFSDVFVSPPGIGQAASYACN